MKIDLKLDNHGVVNIGDSIQNQYSGVNIFQEIHILREHCMQSSDREILDEILELLRKNETKKAGNLLSKLGKEAKNLIQDLSLSLLMELIKKKI